MTFEKVQDVIVEQLGVEKDDIKLESKLKEDLEADSLDAVEIAMGIEDAFSISIPDEDFANLLTVGDIVNYIDNAN